MNKKFMNKKHIAVAIGILAIIVISLTIAEKSMEKQMQTGQQGQTEQSQLKAIRSMQELEKRYEDLYSSPHDRPVWKQILLLPWSEWMGDSPKMQSFNTGSEIDFAVEDGAVPESPVNEARTGDGAKEYSATNIQVENVDEADIIKTDGDYIFSLSQDQVIISDVLDEKNPRISARISINGIPEDLLLYKDKLVVIAASKTQRDDRKDMLVFGSETVVEIYDISDKEKPCKIKSYFLHGRYNTSRCIENKFYIVSSGYLHRTPDGKNIDINYEEDNITKKINLEDIKYFTDINTGNQTLFAFTDLDNPTQDVRVHSYLMNMENAYVSETGIYLAEDVYNYGVYNRSSRNTPPLSSLFGWRGVFGAIFYNDGEEDYYEDVQRSQDIKTTLYKFDILDNGEIAFSAKTKVPGRTVNQFSLDEYQGNLRIALWDWEQGSHVVVLDDKLRQIGETSYLAKGEQMYSSRFMGDKVYLVTYRTTDPLYVIDLSEPTKPTVLGELHIPGYSTYLHPYDDTHLIGFGMETREVVRRDANGKIISTTARIVGMKMALFDVSDVHNPVQMDSMVIGDNRTTSSILTNHKALLFSRQRGLLAIPVNHYREDFEVVGDDTSAESVARAFSSYGESFIAEGYFVYDISLENGFMKKGVIVHDIDETEKDRYYSPSYLLRGLYIGNNLFTVSERELKVHTLDSLEPVSDMKIRGGN